MLSMDISLVTMGRGNLWGFFSELVGIGQDKTERATCWNTESFEFQRKAAKVSGLMCSALRRWQQARTCRAVVGILLLSVWRIQYLAFQKHFFLLRIHRGCLILIILSAHTSKGKCIQNLVQLSHQGSLLCSLDDH